METNFKVSNQIPAVYQKCHEVFGVEWDDGIVITYGDTVYSKFPISPDLKVHEVTHVIQQREMGKDVWWKKYFEDVEFRLSQEKEAYINQSKWIKNNVKDRNERFRRLNKIANDLSSFVYGNIISKSEANKLLL